jgi:Fe-Mn family superoxide dismutase
MHFIKKTANRRDFIKSMGAAGGSLAAMHLMSIPVGAQEDIEALIKKNFPLLKLPYPKDALEPFISSKTVTQHYHKHHKAYHNQLTAYVRVNREYSGMSLENLIERTKGGILLEEALNNFSTLLWNHNFYWQSMKPKGGILLEKRNKLTKKIIDTFDSVDKFKEKFIARTMEIGIGWVWLIKIRDQIKIIRTSYSESPVPTPYPPLFGIDIWEHAYYMDYRADREKYVANFLDNLVNWDFAEANYNK